MSHINTNVGEKVWNNNIIECNFKLLCLLFFQVMYLFDFQELWMIMYFWCKLPRCYFACEFLECYSLYKWVSLCTFIPLDGDIYIFWVYSIYPLFIIMLSQYHPWSWVVCGRILIGYGNTSENSWKMVCSII